MPNKERIMVMIRLAMREKEYGVEVTQSGPLRREYVGGHRFVFFVIESLLYLCFAVLFMATLILGTGITLSISNAAAILAALFVVYLVVTFVGLRIVKKKATKRYNYIKEVRKEYKKDINLLEKLIEDEY